MIEVDIAAPWLALRHYKDSQFSAEHITMQLCIHVFLAVLSILYNSLITVIVGL